MKKPIHIFCTLIILLGLWTRVAAQSSSDIQLTTEEIDQYKEQIKELINYFEGTLNFIGDPENVTKEKEIIINESYLKLFKDDKVQIEDDLDESRGVPLNKDVQGYLKDVEFFFQKVHFKFHITDITFNTNEDNLNYFKITLNRDLQGFTISGDSVSNRKVRFIEINLDIASNDLRIASMYTTKLNEQEEIRNWWNGLSSAWRFYFGENVMVYDSLKLSNVFFIADSLILMSTLDMVSETDTNSTFDVELPPERQLSSSRQDLDSIFVNTGQIFHKLSGIVRQKSVDISNNENIRSLDPLSELSELTELNCANTLVGSLFPLRNLNKLEILDVSNIPVDDISPLQYSTSLKELDCGYTLIEDLSFISGLYNLQELNCSGIRIHHADFATELNQLQEFVLSETRIQDLEALRNLISIDKLDVSSTGINDLEVVSSLLNLRYFNAEHTAVSKIDPLKDLDKLEVLKISYTAIESLEPLNDLTSLKRIYWDGGQDFDVDKLKKREEAINYMKAHPGSLVIFESEELINGWADLEEPWKQLAKNVVHLSENPTREELHSLLQIEEIKIDSTPITTLRPVAQLYNLKSLSVPGLRVDDYDAVGEALELEYLDLSGTSVESVDFAVSLKNLITIRIDHTSVNDLSPLENIDELKFIYADDSGIDENEALKFRKNNKKCIVIFKTKELQNWWETMSESWKTFFTDNFSLDSPPSKEQLHQLFYLEELEVHDQQNIRSFDPVSQLINLRSIKFSKLNVGELGFLMKLTDLNALHCSGMPISDLTALSGLKKLEVLDLQDTPVDDLKPISTCSNIKELKISGTQVKSLKPISSLTKLESIELNNTQVKSISPLFSIASIKSLSCFNTRISEKNIEKFKKENPNCKVVYY